MKKNYFVLIINNKNKNIFEINMNKKQLTESIMAGVKRAFRENKSLNEGFSQWREENAPKFPIEQLNGNTQPLINLCADYISKGYIESIKFGVVVKEKYAEIATLDKGSVNQTSLKSFMLDCEIDLKEKCSKGEDQFNRVMFLTALKIHIPYETLFGKYVKSTINAGSNRINDYEDLINVTLANNAIVLVIKLQDLVNADNANKIVEYFK